MGSKLWMIGPLALAGLTAACSGTGPAGDEQATGKSGQALGYSCVNSGQYSTDALGEIGYCYRGVFDGLQYWELYFESQSDMNGEADHFAANYPEIHILYEGNAGGYWQMNYTRPD